MISDVLSDAVHSINDYLENPTFANVYTGELREHVIKLRDEMTALRIVLDTPPSAMERLGNMETLSEQLRYAQVLQQARQLGLEAKDKGWQLVIQDTDDGGVTAILKPRTRTSE